MTIIAKTTFLQKKAALLNRAALDKLFVKNFAPVAVSQLKLYIEIASALQGLAMTALYALLKTPIHVIARRSKATTNLVYLLHQRASLPLTVIARRSKATTKQSFCKKKAALLNRAAFKTF